MKATTVIKFTKGTSFEHLGWHIAHNPTGIDSTLCGLAHEGECAGPTVYETYKSKEGRPTCGQCKAIVAFCLTLR